jgi:hypothetical protein
MHLCVIARKKREGTLGGIHTAPNQPRRMIVTVTKSKNFRSDKKFDQAREEAFSSEGAPPPTQDSAVPANTGGRKRLKTRARR